MINARDVPVAVGADANQKSKTRMLSDGTITPIGGLTFSECQYLAKMGELQLKLGNPFCILQDH